MKILRQCGLLFIVLILLYGCGNESHKEEAAPVPETQKPTSILEVHCSSSVDGHPLDFHLHLPEDLDLSHSRPLIVVLPGTPLPDDWRAGQAYVARLENTRPAECPSWLLQMDILAEMDYLFCNYAIMREQVYLAANGRFGCEFASENAPLFAGVCLCFSDEPFVGWDGIPIRNLLNIPVYLHKTNFSPSAQDLKERLLAAGDACLNAPEYLLASSPAESLAQAFAWLSAQKPDRNRIIWENDASASHEAWWVRCQRFKRGDRDAIFSAKWNRDGKKLSLVTRNLSAIAVDTSWSDFGETEAIPAEIDGMTLEIPVNPLTGWVELERNTDEIWMVRDGEPQSARSQEIHGLRTVLSKPVLLVIGTANEERSTVWKSAAERFADEWLARTGQRPEICSDDAISSALLQNRNFVLFGSPADNSLTAALLEDDAQFLRGLFAELNDDERLDESVSAMALYHAERLFHDSLAIVVLANSPSAAGETWKSLVESPKEDFIFRGNFGLRGGYFHDKDNMDY